MSDTPRDVTADEIRDRARAAGVAIPDARLEMVRQLVANALRPVRAMDTRALATLEPAVTFDAAGGGTGHGR
jgi:hypothetical protein